MPTGREQSTGSGDDLIVSNRPANEPTYDGKAIEDKGRQVMSDPFASEFEVTPPASQVRQAQGDGGQTADDATERAWVEQTFGATPEEIREVVQDKREGKIAVSFVTEHASDYAATPRNYQVLQNFLASNNLPFTRESLETAFAATQGQLETPRHQGQQAPPRKPSSSGISDASHSPVIAPTAEQAEQEMRTMPLDLLRAKIQREAHARGVRVREGGRSDDGF